MENKKVSVIMLTPREHPVAVGRPWLLDDKLKNDWSTLSRIAHESSSLFGWQEWKESYKNVASMYDWLKLLGDKLAANYDPSTSGPRSFWAYH
jgi:hypothetical protein